MNPLAQDDPPPMPEPLAQPPEAGAVVQQPVPKPPVGLDKAHARQDLIFNLGFLGLAVIGLAVVFSILKYWTRRQTQDCDTTSLGSFREMYENGELSAEEYEQIRNKMAAKLKNKLGVRPKPGVGSNGTPPPPESPG